MVRKIKAKQKLRVVQDGVEAEDAHGKPLKTLEQGKPVKEPDDQAMVEKGVHQIDDENNRRL